MNIDEFYIISISIYYLHINTNDRVWFCTLRYNSIYNAKTKEKCEESEYGNAVDNSRSGAGCWGVSGASREPCLTSWDSEDWSTTLEEREKVSVVILQTFMHSKTEAYQTE